MASTLRVDANRGIDLESRCHDASTLRVDATQFEYKQVRMKLRNCFNMLNELYVPKCQPSLGETNCIVRISICQIVHRPLLLYSSVPDESF